MFEAKTVMMLYAVSPVHMGSGTAIGAIDNPIQRERHTEHPMLAGSGLKGALRDAWPQDTDTDTVFGPEPEKGSEHAGALSVGDAQVVLFPARSLRESYVYATCPTALARFARMLDIAGVGKSIPPIPSPPDDETMQLPSDGVKQLRSAQTQRVVLETFAFSPQESQEAASWGKFLAGRLHDNVGAAFKKKIERHLAVLSDTRFGYFVRNATLVEPHVRIDDETGTADDGGLFYTENVPPETLFASLVLASRSRKPNSENTSAAEVLSKVREQFEGKPVQIGGDATVGRGLVVVSFAG